MIVFFSIVSAVLVFAIAAGVIGREAHRLDGVAPRAIYIPEQAVEYVAARLPDETQARLTMEELGKLLNLHLAWLQENGLQPLDVIDRPQDISQSIVVGEETLTAYLLGEAAQAGVEVLDDVDVVHVVRAHFNYFDAIGAVGPNASSNDL